MKRIFKTISIILVVALSLVLLCGCSTYGKLKSVCNEEKYMELNDVIRYFDVFDLEEGKNLKIKLEEEIEKVNELLKILDLKNVNIYTFVKVGEFERDIDIEDLTYEISTKLEFSKLLIMEFSSGEEVSKALRLNNDFEEWINLSKEEIKESPDEIQKLSFVNGNCVFKGPNTIMEKLDAK